MKKYFFTGAVVLLLLFAGIYALRHNTIGKKQLESLQGRWHKLRQEQRRNDADETYQKLIGLGYLEGYKAASGVEGITIYQKDAAYNGLNFFVSGHAPEAILMDMEGTVLHTWRYKNACEIWKNIPANEPSASYWRRAHLYKNGDILAIYEGIGMVKLDKNSNLIWAYTSLRAPHHDLEVLDDGTIYILTRERKKIPHLSTEYVFDEFITVLNSTGKCISEYSLIDLIEKSAYSRMLVNDAYVKSGGFFGHILHTNTLEVFDGSMSHISPLFKKGNVLVSILINHTICIIDWEAKQVVWALGSGMWRHQHQPTLLQNGNMLIFDNKDSDSVSAIKEFNPFSQKIIWQYKGTSEKPFYSETCGSNQRLPNGNTLITETDNGRAFEVTSNSTIVWEYINPYRAGKNKELIASLFEMIRINQEEINLETD